MNRIEQARQEAQARVAAIEAEKEAAKQREAERVAAAKDKRRQELEDRDQAAAERLHEMQMVGARREADLQKIAARRKWMNQGGTVADFDAQWPAMRDELAESILSKRTAKVSSPLNLHKIF